MLVPGVVGFAPVALVTLSGLGIAHAWYVRNYLEQVRLTQGALPEKIDLMIQPLSISWTSI